MYKKILAPVDGSELAECSLQHVKAIASGCQVPEVILLWVLEPIASEAAAWLGDEFLGKSKKNARAKIEEYLDKVATGLASEGIAVQKVIVEGLAAEEILKYADKNVDLIIMSSHGSSGIARWALGSVSDKVIRHSKVPVLMAIPKSCRII